jgi:hypothetical protein
VVEYLRLFYTFYSESNKIIKAKRDASNYRIPNCAIKFPFNPVDGIKEDKAYKILVEEATSITDETKLSFGRLYLQGLNLNNSWRKTELVKLFAKALATIAELILVDAEVEDYSKHDLVADLLLEHHEEFLKNRTNILHFVQIYKKVHQCGRPFDDFEDTESLFNLRFLSTAVVFQGSTSEKALTAAGVAVTPAVAPNPSRNLNTNFESAAAVLARNQASASADKTLTPAATNITQTPASDPAASPVRIIKNGRVYVKEKSLDAGVANHIKGGIEVIPETQADLMPQQNTTKEGSSSSHPIVLEDNSIQVTRRFFEAPLFLWIF